MVISIKRLIVAALSIMSFYGQVEGALSNDQLFEQASSDTLITNMGDKKDDQDDGLLEALSQYQSNTSIPEELKKKLDDLHARAVNVSAALLADLNEYNQALSKNNNLSFDSKILELKDKLTNILNGEFALFDESDAQAFTDIKNEATRINSDNTLSGGKKFALEQIERFKKLGVYITSPTAGGTNNINSKTN